jgi:hypothetical protein
MLKNIKTNQSKETMKNDTMPKTTIINSYKRIIDINKIDVSFRDLQDNDNQFEIMKFILNCLSDEQIKDTKKLIKVWKQYEKKQSN